MWAERSNEHTSLLFPGIHISPLVFLGGFCTPSGSVDQTGSHTFHCAAKWITSRVFPRNYRFLSGLASIISQSLHQVQQLLYYCNHGDLLAVWFAVEMYSGMRVGGGSASVRLCTSSVPGPKSITYLSNTLLHTHVHCLPWPLGHGHNSGHKVVDVYSYGACQGLLLYMLKI